ncbi:hypothetical protein J4479_00510 [Candidatus Woesearchaeota archaeon]|nr:hypothetical protein [Candidatus Woesearchaeota archaeon]
MMAVPLNNEKVSLSTELYDFVSKLTAEELVYLLYKDHLLYDTSPKQEIYQRT